MLTGGPVGGTRIDYTFIRFGSLKTPWLLTMPGDDYGG